MGDAVIVWRSEEAPAGQTLSGEHASCQNAQRKLEAFVELDGRLLWGDPRQQDEWRRRGSKMLVEVEGT
jgi:hypothetical protein